VIGTPVGLGTAAGSSSHSSRVLTTTADAPAGDAIIVAVMSNLTGRTLSSVTDSAGNTYVIDESLGTTSNNVWIASCLNPAHLPSGGTISANFGSTDATASQVHAMSVSGLKKSGALDQHTSASFGLGSAWSISTPSATTVPDELVVGVASASGGAFSSTPGATYTELYDTPLNARGFTTVYKIVSATGVQTPSGTWSTGSSKIVAVVTYEADTAQSISGAGAIASAEAFGTPTVTPGAVTVHPSGIASAEAFGTPTIIHAALLAPSGIASAEAFGTPTVTLGAVILGPSGIASAEAFGTPTVTVGIVTVGPSGIASAEAFGTLTVTVGAAAVFAIAPIPAGRELRFQVTTLRYPDADPIVLCELQQFTDGKVGIPLNDGRDGEVTISVYDDAYRVLTSYFAGPLDEYAAMLRAFYDGTCVLWAPITGAPFKGADGTVTLTASDKVRLENHEVVIGDEAIDIENGFDGRIPVDSRGLRLLRDAAINLPGQTARGVPDIGIADGSDDVPDNDVFITIERGTEVWSAMQDLLSHGPSPGHAGAPDVEFEPRVDLPGAYVQMNTYSHQGYDKTDVLVFQFGFGRENLADYDSDPLGKIITHQHALGRNNKIRETRADLASSAYRGLYVKWSSQDYTGSDADLRVALGAWAQQQVEAYSVPPHVVKITLKPEDEVTDPLGRFRYLRDFTIGDEVRAEARRGYHREVSEGRIVKVTLSQQDQGKKALADLDLVPNVGGGDGSSTEDD
jgi:hypothetical protein